MEDVKSSRLFDLEGQSVVMSGATGVLGGAVAEALLSRGVNLTLIVRDSSRAQRLRDRAESSRRRIVVVEADISDLTALGGALDLTLREFQRVDALLNFAGGNSPGATVGDDLAFWDVPAGEIRSVLELNLMGTILPCQVFGRPMAEQGSGSIINISSVASLRPLTRVVAYSAAKAAVNSFTRWLAVHMAREYSPRIRVNAVAPGFFLTSQNRHLLEDDDGKPSRRARAVLSQTPMKGFGQPEDLVGTIVWLLSPASRFVTGAVVPVDGGFSAFSGV